MYMSINRPQVPVRTASRIAWNEIKIKIKHASTYVEIKDNRVMNTIYLQAGRNQGSEQSVVRRNNELQTDTVFEWGISVNELKIE